MLAFDILGLKKMAAVMFRSVHTLKHEHTRESFSVCVVVVVVTEALVFKMQSAVCFLFV